MGWRVPLLVALVATLAACGKEPTRTTVTPPQQTLPENAPLHGAAPPAPAPPVAAGPQGVPPAQPPAVTTVPPAPPLAAAPPAPVAPLAPLPQVRNIGDAEGARLLAQRPLLVPVAGIPPNTLSDHYELARGGRVHEAIDIMAPEGTPVVAVDDGRIAKLFTSKGGGGLTVYHYDPSSQLAYYYAHLQRYAEGLREGMEVKRGDLIGYVGSTGNANAQAPHLHFAVFRLGTPPNWWQGEAVNPYPALSRAMPAPQVASR
jgi:murein DD-endopeptidase MepM/ murein hydrolase activator NlpD